MKRFALIGAGGYIAPRHLAAIRDTGNLLVAALDPVDASERVYAFFPEARAFREEGEFEDYLRLLVERGEGVDYVSIASPNHLHAAHIRLALRVGAHALCEKPLAVRVEDLEDLKQRERETGRRLYTVLQLRVHPELARLRERLRADDRVHEVYLTYVTGRDPSYLKTWKGQSEKSGGLAMHIGIHFFDLLLWYFGNPVHLEVHRRDDATVAGFLELERARVRWFLSLDAAYVPEPYRRAGKMTYRSIVVDGEEIDFSRVPPELHTEVYRRTLAGEGFGISEAEASIRLTAAIRELPVVSPPSAHVHPLLAEAK
ncbi:MAG TPA: Gfo/Idh/MocA family oxidoreductase [Bacillaceae bacterium]|nr:Gfo/Idh/MocA family oxidoreductase [Bacillaceae bacterium]